MARTQGGINRQPPRRSSWIRSQVGSSNRASNPGEFVILDEPTPPPLPVASKPLAEETDDEEPSLLLIQCYKKLLKRHVKPTVYLDELILQQLVLYEDVIAMLDFVGLRRMVTGEWEAYPDLTYEFYSSLDIVDVNVGSFKFRLDRREFEWGLNRLIDCFGLSCVGAIVDDMDVVEYWGMITHEAGVYDAGSSKATFIRNPLVRYLQRLISYTVTGRSTNRNVVENFELMVLHDMLTNTRRGVARGILRHLIEVRTRSGDITVGGLVIAIARFEGISLEQRFSVGQVDRLDRGYLKKIEVLSQQNEIFFWHIRTSEFVALPNDSA